MPEDPTSDQVWLHENGFLVDRLSRKCLDVRGNPGRSRGLAVELFDCEFDLEPDETDKRWELLAACEVQEGVFSYFASRPSCLSTQFLDGAGLCMDCPPGQFSADGRQCTKCLEHQHWSTESGACADCPAGTAVSEDGTHCVPESTIFCLQNPGSGLCARVYVSQDYSIKMEQCGRESEVWYFRNGQVRSVSSQFCLNVNGNPGEENGLGTSAGIASRHELFTRITRQPHRPEVVRQMFDGPGRSDRERHTTGSL